MKFPRWITLFASPPILVTLGMGCSTPLYFSHGDSLAVDPSCLPTCSETRMDGFFLW